MPPVTSLPTDSEPLFPPTDQFTATQIKTSNPTKTISSHQALPERTFPTASTFSIDLDPFSSSSSTSINSLNFNDRKSPIQSALDPFGIGPFENTVKEETFKQNKDPFAVFDKIPIIESVDRMSKKEEIPALNFNNVDELDGSTAYDEQPEPEIDEPENSPEPVQKTEEVAEPQLETQTSGSYEMVEPEEEPTSKEDEEDVQDTIDSHLSRNMTVPSLRGNKRSQKKQSYDTIQSLDLSGTRKNTNESEDNSNDENDDSGTNAAPKFTLEDAVEDESSTDTRQSFMRILPGKKEDRKSSLQFDNFEIRYNDKEEVEEIVETIDEEETNSNNIEAETVVENSNPEQQVDETKEKSTNEKNSHNDKDDRTGATGTSQSTLTTVVEKKPFIAIKKVNLQVYYVSELEEHIHNWISGNDLIHFHMLLLY